MARLLNRFGTTALASVLLMPAVLPLVAHAQQASDTTAPKTKKKARHKSAAVPANNGAGASRPDPLDPHGTPAPPIPTTQGPPPPATRPSTNTPIAPH